MDTYLGAWVCSSIHTCIGIPAVGTQHTSVDKRRQAYCRRMYVCMYVLYNTQSPVASTDPPNVLVPFCYYTIAIPILRATATSIHHSLSTLEVLCSSGCLMVASRTKYSRMLATTVYVNSLWNPWLMSLHSYHRAGSSVLCFRSNMHMRALRVMSMGLGGYEGSESELQLSCHDNCHTYLIS